MSNFTSRPYSESLSSRRQDLQRAVCRIKSESPNDTQTDSELTDDPLHRRRLRDPRGLAPDTPTLTDILRDFSPPERSVARFIKEEPRPEHNLNPSTIAMISMISPKVGKNSRKSKPVQPRKSAIVDLTDVDDPPEDTVRDSSSTRRSSRSNLHKETRLNSSKTLSSQRVDPESSPSAESTLPSLTREQLRIMDHCIIPPAYLTQIQDACKRAEKRLPSRINTWLGLKEFASRNDIHLLSADSIKNAQAHLYHEMVDTPTQSTTKRVPVVRAVVHSRQGPASSPQLKEEEESESIEMSGSFEDIDQSRILPLYNRLRRSQRRQTSRSNTRNAVPLIIDLDPPTNPTRPPTLMASGVTDLQIQRLMEPLSTCSELLPPDAPESYPHLVQVWDPALVGLPKDKHDHLNLIDTVVSIIYKYDETNQHALKAFLDVDKVKHFFFLFKSRNNKCHSWSIEREGSYITIGIERNERAPNVATESPSAGQYDLTIRYQLQSYSFVAPDDNQTASVKPALACWIPTGRSILPSRPPLDVFLYDTPPNRGADEHERYSHSATHVVPLSNLTNAPQSVDNVPPEKVPSDRLSILARYFQKTAFTALAMDAEFQVCWGHKVRYDAGMGRIRAAFTNALRGAITQAKRREAGEYNRPVSSDVQSTNGSAEKPGSGLASSHLKDGEGNGKGKKAKGAGSKKRKRKEGDVDAEDSGSEYVENE